MSDTPTGNLSAAIQFLQNWKPEGPWTLSAIPPTKDGFNAITFGPDTMAEGATWLNQRIGIDNIYFSVNPLLKPLNGPGAKAYKSDVRGMAWFHVDIDPRPGEDFIQERERALRVLRAFSPKPSVIVDSGGGYQGFWRLDQELPINGDVARAEEYEAYNIQIALMLSADACHNSDRIMRLPGTVNVPDAKKRAKGRVPAPALLVEADWSVSYPVSAFTAAPRVVQRQTDGFASTAPATRVSLGGNLPNIDLDALNIPLKTRMMIVQGNDPDEPQRYASRSEAVFAVCCQMIRAGCSDEQIGAVLLDRNLGISAHILAQPRPQAYAERQIQRAREEAINPHLRELNERHAVIEDMGGKCRVVSEVYDPAMKRFRLSKQSFEDFRNRYMHIPIVVGHDDDNQEITVSLGKFWLTNRNRRQYRTLIFSPGHEVQDCYNLWRGFACEARPGKCDLYLKHIHDNICSGRKELYDYLLDWMARCVQKPDSPGEVCVVLRGNEGAGKGKFVKVFGSLWGRHFLQVSNSKHLVGNFNAHLRDCVVLFGDEAFYAGDKQHESVLKTLVTEETLFVEPKGVDAEAAPNFVHLVLSSNGDWVVPTGHGARRYLVLDVTDGSLQNFTYFAEIDHEMDNGGREALLYFLMTRNIAGFQVRLVPKTDGLQDQKLLSLSPLEEWWHERLQEGRIGRNGHWPEELTKDELVGDLTRYLDRQKVMRRPSPTSLGKFLRRVSPEGKPTVSQRWADLQEDDGRGGYTTRRARVQFYGLASLQEARGAWDTRYGAAGGWITIAEPEAITTPGRAPF